MSSALCEQNLSEAIRYSESYSPHTCGLNPFVLFRPFSGKTYRESSSTESQDASSRDFIKLLKDRKYSLSAFIHSCYSLSALFLSLDRSIVSVGMDAIHLVLAKRLRSLIPFHIDVDVPQQRGGHRKSFSV